MRRRLTLILFIFLLGGFVALGQAGLLSLPFNIVVSLNISMPETWRRLAATERAGPSTKLQKERQPDLLKIPLSPRVRLLKKGQKPPRRIPQISGIRPSQSAALNIARISPSGPSVFGGSAAPFAQVTVLDDTTAVATTTANANGDWSLVTEYKFANTDPKISVRAADPSEKSTLAAPAMHDSHFSSFDRGSNCRSGAPGGPAFERVRGRGGDCARGSQATGCRKFCQRRGDQWTGV